MAISAACLRLRQSYPFLAVGWLWFLGTLVPVIGLVQVGSQAHADRYMYVPMVGLSIMVAWSADALCKHRPQLKVVVIAGAASAGIACIVLTSIQLPVWSDSESLFRHAIRVTSRNYLALHNLGSALLEKPDRLQEAVEDLQASLVIKPDSVAVLTDLGTAFAKMGRFSQAIAEYERALRISPTSEITRRDLAEARINAAVSESNLAAELSRDPGHFDQAVAHYEAAIAFDPDSADTHYNLGVTLEKIEGRSNDAIAEFEVALRLNPNYAEAHNDLGVALTRSRLPDAIAHFEAALRTRPDYADAHYNLGVALSEVPGRLPDAIAQFEAAQRLNPDPEIKRILERLRRR